MSGMSNAKEMLNQIPVAYAITYLWGTIGTGIILSQLGPKLDRCQRRRGLQAVRSEMSKGAPEGGMASAWHQLSSRAFKVNDGAKVVGMKVSEAEAAHAADRTTVERIRRDGKIIDVEPDTTLQAGDVVAVSGPTESSDRLSSSMPRKSTTRNCSMFRWSRLTWSSPTRRSAAGR